MFSSSDVERGRSVPIRNNAAEILVLPLAAGDLTFETHIRARGATEARHSVQVADVGSNPAGSILRSVENEIRGENTEIIYLR